MKPSPSTPHVFREVVFGGALSAAVYTLSFPPFEMAWLAWFALAPVLVIIPRLSGRVVEWLGFLTGFAIYAIGFRWFGALFGFLAVALWGLLALFFAVFCVLVRSLPQTMTLGWRILLIPCFWVAVEYVRCEQWPLRFSWLALGYSQYHNRGLLPLAGFVGVYGISFVLVAFSVFVAGAWRERPLVAAGFVAVWAAIWYPMSAFSVHREGVPHPDKGRIVLVQSPSTIRRDLAALGDAAMRGPSVPTLLVWPEYAVQFTEEESADAYAALRKLARDRDVTFVFGGVKSRSRTKYSSAAFVIGPQGKDMGLYEKHNPLPFFKDGEPGGGYPVFHWNGGQRAIPFGVTICFDLSFERNARMLAKGGARFLVVPSMEPSDWPRLEQEQHAIIAPLRAAENGIGITRCSTPGPSQVVGPAGWTYRALEAGREGVVVDRPVMGDGRRTVYNRLGWLFPYTCQAVTAAWVASLIARRLRRRRASLNPGRVG